MELAPFERIVDEHADRVWRVCRALTGPDDADDVWSETFLAALRAYPDLRSERNIGGWLVTIAHNKAMDHHRRAARRPTPIEPADTAIANRATPDATALVDRLVDEDISALLRHLTDRQRTAVVLHHVAGLPYAEVAATIGGSAPAARRAAADGMARLRTNAPEETTS